MELLKQDDKSETILRLMMDMSKFSTAMEKLMGLLEIYNDILDKSKKPKAHPVNVVELVEQMTEIVNVYLVGLERTHIDKNGVEHITDINTIYCSGCEKELDVEKFNKNKSNKKTGYQGNCKICMDVKYFGKG